MFVWLVLQKSIQVNQYRFQCNMADSPNCVRCSGAVEDILHCLRDCPHSREIWMRAGALRWPGFLVADCGAWVQRQAQGINGVKFIACLWGIWKWRNNMIFESQHWEIHEAWRRLCHDHDEMVQFRAPATEVDDRVWMASRWLKPPAGAVNLCVDGSFRPDDGSMGAGGIVRDDQGKWVFGFHAFQEQGNTLMSEAYALKLGLLLIWDRGFRRVICNVDCAELLQSLRDEESRHFLPILEEISGLLSRNWDISLARIDRDYNRPADWLARKGASSPSSPLNVLINPPGELEILIMEDRLGVP